MVNEIKFVVSAQAQTQPTEQKQNLEHYSKKERERHNNIILENIQERVTATCKWQTRDMATEIKFAVSAHAKTFPYIVSLTFT